MGHAVVIYLVAALAYAALGSLQDIPLVAPDEFRNGLLARSLANGDGLSIYGVAVNFRAALYIYLLAPSWILSSGESAYALAKLTGAFAACSVVFPVWALGRRMLPGRDALLPTILTLAGTWMISTAGLLNENIAFPLATACLVAAVLGLREQRSAWPWTGLAFATAATLARLQLGVLFAVLLAATMIYGFIGGNPRAYVRANRGRSSSSSLAIVVIGGAARVSGGKLGSRFVRRRLGVQPVGRVRFSPRSASSGSPSW